MARYDVPEMSCGHCTAAIEKAVLDADQGAEIACDLETRQVEIDSVLDAAAILAAIKTAGYDATQA